VPGLAVQNGLIEAAEHEVPPAGQDGTAGVDHRRWQLGGEWGQRFTQHNVDQLLGRAGELGVNLLDTDERYGDHLAEVHGVEGSWPCRRSRRVRRIGCGGWLRLEFVTLDCVMEAPGHDQHRDGKNAWALRYADPDQQRYKAEERLAAGAVLRGG
jgi:hypothetical protein